MLRKTSYTWSQFSRKSSTLPALLPTPCDWIGRKPILSIWLHSAPIACLIYIPSHSAYLPPGAAYYTLATIVGLSSETLHEAESGNPWLCIILRACRLLNWKKQAWTSPEREHAWNWKTLSGMSIVKAAEFLTKGIKPNRTTITMTTTTITISFTSEYMSDPVFLPSQDQIHTTSFSCTNLFICFYISPADLFQPPPHPHLKSVLSPDMFFLVRPGFSLIENHTSYYSFDDSFNIT